MIATAESTLAPLAVQRRALPELHLAGAALPPALRTAGAVALLLAAIAATGVVLVGFAVLLPFALLAAAIGGRWQKRSERPGWREAQA